jgi:pyruvate dehydrogenase complex dehydrogenase (E1) component
MNMNDDADPAETGEWLDALKAVELSRPIRTRG